jgi:hypothetical protein
MRAACLLHLYYIPLQDLVIVPFLMASQKVQLFSAFAASLWMPLYSVKDLLQSLFVTTCKKICLKAFLASPSDGPLSHYPRLHGCPCCRQCGEEEPGTLGR